MQQDTDTQFKEAAALHRAGRLPEAERLYRELLRSRPDDPSLLNNLAHLALQNGRPGVAVRMLERLLKICPDHPMALFNLADAQQRMGQLKQALASYDRAVVLEPGGVAIQIGRGILLQRMYRYEEALACHDAVLAIKPDSPDVLYRRGVVLYKLNRFEEAVDSFDRAIALRPDFAVAYSDRGASLQLLSRLDEAGASLEKAIAINPAQPSIYLNRAYYFQFLKRFDAAAADFERALALNPEFGDAHHGRAMLRLLMGDYLGGWQEHEWRWESTQKPMARKMGCPQWLGDAPVDGKTVMVFAEQGLGDTLQFSRYVPMLAALGAKVILEMPGPLVAVMASLPSGNISVVRNGAEMPPCDFYSPISSLPMAFKTEIATIPADFPYLRADPEKQRVWRDRLGKKTRPRIGLAWSGLIGRRIDFHPCRKRNLPLKLLAPLLDLPLEFHSLQKDIRPEDADFLRGVRDFHQHQADLHDFSDTAALIEEMDLVISIDTSVAHLAGAMGKPMWVLLPYATDFRWMNEGAHTPWYPGADLFRQTAIGDWGPVISEVRARLAAW